MHQASSGKGEGVCYAQYWWLDVMLQFKQDIINDILVRVLNESLITNLHLKSPLSRRIDEPLPPHRSKYGGTNLSLNSTMMTASASRSKSQAALDNLLPGGTSRSMVPSASRAKHCLPRMSWVYSTSPLSLLNHLTCI